jgi:hypothetical protein
MATPEEDELVVLDKRTKCHIFTKPLPGCYDVHQIDVYSGRLWMTNTNFHELVVIDLAGRHRVQRLRLLKNAPEERTLTLSNCSHITVDHRRRPHINSIQVRKDHVQIGLFGKDRGDFKSSQLLCIPLCIKSDGVDFGPIAQVAVHGLRYPHNTHLMTTGRLLACSSATGEVLVGDERILVGGWVRGIAIDDRSIYVGVSSNSYSFTGSSSSNTVELPARIVRINRERLEIDGEFLFPRCGQIYDVRISQVPDYGMSQYAETQQRLAQSKAA